MNESNILNIVIFLGQYSFFLELFFAMLIILSNAKKRKYFFLRALIFLGISFPLYYLPLITLGRFSYSYILVMTLVFIYGLFLYKEPVFLILLAAVGSWAIQHFAWNFMSIIFDLIPNVATALSHGSILTIFLVGLFVIYFAFFLLFYKLKIVIRQNKAQVFSFFFAAVVIICAMFLSQLVTQWNIILRIYSCFVVFMALCVMIGFPYLYDLIIKERNLANEKNNLENMLVLQAKQQKLSKETIDVMNLKFHDMKNQIQTLKHVNQVEKDYAVSELEDSIDIYTNIARTNNEAIDIVITQKSLLCSSKRIRFTYIIDGKSLSFLSTSDITSLYGNIIDNAIEAVEREKDDFRLIKLRTYKQGGLILIQEENYCHNSLSFDNNQLPISTKNDSINHGYGLKSIKYIVDKYEGQLTTTLKDDVFTLLAAIPSKD